MFRYKLILCENTYYSTPNGKNRYYNNNNIINYIIQSRGLILASFCKYCEFFIFMKIPSYLQFFKWRVSELCWAVKLKYSAHYPFLYYCRYFFCHVKWKSTDLKCRVYTSEWTINGATRLAVKDTFPLFHNLLCFSSQLYSGICQPIVLCSWHQGSICASSESRIVILKRVTALIVQYVNKYIVDFFKIYFIQINFISCFHFIYLSALVLLEMFNSEFISFYISTKKT